MACCICCRWFRWWHAAGDCFVVQGQIYTLDRVVYKGVVYSDIGLLTYDMKRNGDTWDFSGDSDNDYLWFRFTENDQFRLHQCWVQGRGFVQANGVSDPDPCEQP